MATWHQEKVGLHIPGAGYIIVSDKTHHFRSQMSFGENREAAFESLELHRLNQPSMDHYLYYNGKLVA